MNNSSPLPTGQKIIRCLLFQKFTEQVNLNGELASAWVVWQQIQQFIAEDRSTTRFENDYWSSSLNLLRERVQNLKQQAPGTRAKTKIVKRPPAAQHFTRQHHFEPRSHQDLYRCPCGVRKKVIVKCVRPEQHLPALMARHPPLRKPRAKSLWCKPGDTPLLRHSRG